MRNNRGKVRLNKDLKKGKRGIFSRNIFVQSPTLNDGSDRRLNLLIRTTASIVIVIGIILLFIFLFSYLIPFLQSEFSAKTEEDSQSGASYTTDEVQKYDSLGLPVYDNSINLFVINADNPKDQTYVPDTDGVEGTQVNKKIVPALKMLIEAAKKDGYKLSFQSGYVPYHEQEMLYDKAVEDIRNDSEGGKTLIMARKDAEEIVSPAGQSDFQTGMCLKVEGSKEDFASSKTYDWLNKNMVKYGFVFRYPSDKTTFTGMAADYTVIRYVGVENAEKMRQFTMCLEEYIDYLNNQGG